MGFLDQFSAAHPAAFMACVVGVLVGFSIACVIGHSIYQKLTARPEDAECVGGKTPCNCTCSYDCHLA